MHPSPRKGSGRPCADRLEVFRVVPGQTFDVLALSESYGGCFVHWVKTRSHYCDPDGCQPSMHRNHQRDWKGYFAAHAYDEQLSLWIPVVMEITSNAELDMRDRYARGQIWRISRLPELAKKKMPVTAELVEERAPADVAKDFVILPTLYRLFTRTDVRLDQPNPMPPRTHVEPSNAPPPPGKGERAPVEQIVSKEEAEHWRQERLKMGIGNRPTGGNGKRPGG